MRKFEIAVVMQNPFATQNITNKENSPLFNYVLSTTAGYTQLCGVLRFEKKLSQNCQGLLPIRVTAGTKFGRCKSTVW